MAKAASTGSPRSVSDLKIYRAFIEIYVDLSRAFVGHCVVTGVSRCEAVTDRAVLQYLFS